MLNIGSFEVLIGIVPLTVLGLLVVALVDLVRRPPGVWAASGHSQLMWALIVIFVGIIGPILYLLVARPALAAVTPPRAGSHS